ncbi:MAG: AAA family ATPase [Longimicrobiaceae bacterium]
MNSDRLMLPSLQIRSYRGIRDLVIPELAQVNLFVGKNNVGKTSLLEAVRLHAAKNPRVTFTSLVRERSSFRPPVTNGSRRGDLSSEEVRSAVRAVEQLFFGGFDGSPAAPILIGPAGLESDVLQIDLPWLQSVQPDLWSTTDETNPDELFFGPESPLIRIERFGRSSVLPLEWFLRRYGVAVGPESRADTTFVSANGFEAFRIGYLWDYVAEAGYGEEVEEALRTVIPDLDRVYLLGEAEAGGRSVFLARHGIARPIPLRSMGDGLNRVFGLTLALVRSAGGIVLVDEIENGLHYSIQEDVWRAVIKLAAHLNVQLFATTHSWDTITAFARAVRDVDRVQGRMHRLEVGHEELAAVEFSEEDLALVTRQRIEVR